MKMIFKTACILWLGLLANTAFAEDYGVVVHNQSNETVRMNVTWWHGGLQSGSFSDGADLDPGQVVRKVATSGLINQIQVTVNSARWSLKEGDYFVKNLFYCPDGTLKETFCTEYTAFTQTIKRTKLPIPGGWGSSQECLDLQENQSGTIVDNNVIRWDYQADGDLVLYTSVGNIPLWSAGVAGNRDGKLCYKADSNLVIKNAAGDIVWSSETAGNAIF